MKKIFFMTMTMVFALTLSLAYAGDKAGKEMFNGVTDFTGRTFDTLELGQDREIASAEGAAAGGLRVEESMKELSNGVSDFSGRSYDTL